MARMKLPDSSKQVKKENISNGNDVKNSKYEENKQAEAEDIKPMIITQEKYLELFGSSSDNDDDDDDDDDHTRRNDNEEQSMHYEVQNGIEFIEKEENHFNTSPKLPPTIFNRQRRNQMSDSSSNNPYKKSYFSYRKAVRKCVEIESIESVDSKNFAPKFNGIHKTAKGLLNKALKSKRDSALTILNQTKLSCNEITDVCYAKRKFNEISGVKNCEEVEWSCDSQCEEEESLDSDTSPSTKKQVKIKQATRYVNTPPRKRVKVKNSFTPEKTDHNIASKLDLYKNWRCGKTVDNITAKTETECDVKKQEHRKARPSDHWVNHTGNIKMKALKVNGAVEFVNGDNCLLTFCGQCRHCLRKNDCGTCKHCRNDKGHSVRYLPCYLRRCKNPTVGRTVALKERCGKPLYKSFRSVKKKALPPKPSVCTLPKVLLPPAKLAVEPVEESIVVHELSQKSSMQHIAMSDNSLKDSFVEDDIPTSGSGAASKIDSPNKIFACSPIKPKLRSTMHELTKQSNKNHKLLRIQCDLGTVVKLPWPKDYKEDAAWIAGHHLCLTAPIVEMSASLCFLCGSGGREKCCEPFHAYCLDVEPIDTTNWSCDRCKRCSVCGLKGNLLMCDKCHDCYHGDCLGPFYHNDTEGEEEIWVCGKCVKCLKCGRRTPGDNKSSKWTQNFTMCEACGFNWSQRNFCPLCLELYNENDDSLKMMFCSKCESWVHMECEGINGDEYEILAILPTHIPYFCRMCSPGKKENKDWYKAIQQELKTGFRKVYYDMISQQEFKILNSLLPKSSSLIPGFDLLLDTIQQSQIDGVQQFDEIMTQVLKKLSTIIKDAKIFHAVEIGRLSRNYQKTLKMVFPWYFTQPQASTTNVKKKPTPGKSDLKHIDSTVMHDHPYFTLPWKPPSTIPPIKDLKSPRSIDTRQCMFCSCYGDGEEVGAGRLLYVGADEWVHINCALWSAEVYEDEEGRLRQVYEAVKRGNKLKCETCNQFGATIGCCFLKCPRSYHFVCARSDEVLFLDDKKIYCCDHASRANQKLILSAEQLQVHRRVLVDLSRFKTLKRVQRGIEPQSVRVLCGSFTLQSLGSLAEKSDLKKYLLPVGYKVTKVFWSTKSLNQRCKYTCEVQPISGVTETPRLVVEKHPEVNRTVCHDVNEWAKIETKLKCSCDNNTTAESRKRKFGFDDDFRHHRDNIYIASPLRTYCFFEDQNAFRTANQVCSGLSNSSTVAPRMGNDGPVETSSSINTIPPLSPLHVSPAKLNASKKLFINDGETTNSNKTSRNDASSQSSSSATRDSFLTISPPQFALETLSYNKPLEFHSPSTYSDVTPKLPSPLICDSTSSKYQKMTYTNVFTELSNLNSTSKQTIVTPSLHTGLETIHHLNTSTPLCTNHKMTYKLVDLQNDFPSKELLEEVPASKKRKYKRRIKIADDDLPNKTDTMFFKNSPCNTSYNIAPSLLAVTSNLTIPMNVQKPEVPEEVAQLIDSFDISQPVLHHSPYMEHPELSADKPSVQRRRLRRMQKEKKLKSYVPTMNRLLKRERFEAKKQSETQLKFVLKSEDGWSREGSSWEVLWKKFMSEINKTRVEAKLAPFVIDVSDAYDFLGISKEFVTYLVEQLPGGHRCRNYKFQHHLPCISNEDENIPINPSGCARCEVVIRKGKKDMFAWLASPYRHPPKPEEQVEDDVVFGAQELPVAIQYRLLKNLAEDRVGVFRSKIEGRGLFSKKNVEAGEMLIEYTGEKLRASLTDIREAYYERKGYGCYMFRIDDMHVADATMKGNAARFINHSCEPNCFSRIISVDGCKKIVIFALRRVTIGEELTYDYKFAKEDDKLPCFCGARKCRKFLN